MPTTLLRGTHIYTGPSAGPKDIGLTRLVMRPSQLPHVAEHERSIILPSREGEIARPIPQREVIPPMRRLVIELPRGTDVHEAPCCRTQVGPASVGVCQTRQLMVSTLRKVMGLIIGRQGNSPKTRVQRLPLPQGVDDDPIPMPLAAGGFQDGPSGGLLISGRWLEVKL